VGPPTPPANVFLVAAEGSDDVVMRVVDDQIEVLYHANGQETQVVSEDFDHTTMRWWRLLEDGGTTYWQTSPDGAAWTDRSVVSPKPIDVTAVDIRFGGTTPMDNPMPGQVVFDNFNVTR
jgi:hypothetical protein